MAGGIDWFRWHHGSVTDPKFQLVARKAGASLPDVLAVWAWLLEKASAADMRGSFGDVDAESLDCLFGFPDDQGTTGYILLAMEARGLIADGRICAWESRQPKRERDDDSSERVAKHRAKKHQETPDENHVTPRNAKDNQETPREEERREEGKPLHVGKVSRPSATRLPADWSMSQEDCEFCMTTRPDLNTLETASRFRDYWIAQPGVKGRKVDWSATWRNWVRNEKARGSPGGPVKFDVMGYSRRKAMGECHEG